MQNAERGYGGEDFATFSDKSVRLGFIRKVYGILMCQIAVNVAIIALFTFSKSTINWVQMNPVVLVVAFLLLFITIITLACCRDIRRKTPINFVCLGIFTLAEGFLLGCTTSMYNTEEVFYAALITLVVTLGLTLFAFQTRIDFTVMGGVLFVALLILLMFGITCAFMPGRTANLVYASLGALIFSVYIVYDTQIMISGKHKYALSPEEYVFAALNLYLDIVNMFLIVLMIFGAFKK